ncbi:MAG: hypothetical protein RLZZ01_808 [Actinomycetota bacterium]
MHADRSVGGSQWRTDTGEYGRTMASRRNVSMTGRNSAWLAVIIVVGLVTAVRSGWAAGLLAAAVTLVISEVYERARRSRVRREAAGRTGR